MKPGDLVSVGSIGHGRVTQVSPKGKSVWVHLEGSNFANPYSASCVTQITEAKDTQTQRERNR